MLLGVTGPWTFEHHCGERGPSNRNRFVQHRKHSAFLAVIGTRGKISRSEVCPCHELVLPLKSAKYTRAYAISVGGIKANSMNHRATSKHHRHFLFMFRHCSFSWLQVAFFERRIFWEKVLLLSSWAAWDQFYKTNDFNIHKRDYFVLQSATERVGFVEFPDSRGFSLNLYRISCTRDFIRCPNRTLYVRNTNSTRLTETKCLARENKDSPRMLISLICHLTPMHFVTLLYIYNVRTYCSDVLISLRCHFQIQKFTRPFHLRL